MQPSLPKLYAILDAETCARRGFRLLAVAQAWRDANVQSVQYRDKVGSDADVLRNTAAIRDVFAGTDAVLILNDRVHLFADSGFNGVHVGQTDQGVHDVRAAVGPDAIVGISTHNPEQLVRAEELAASYIAIGPVYATSTKTDADPVVGIEGVRKARALTTKPLVAIGGITRENALTVLAAGADSVAVISGLLPAAGAPVSALMDSVRDFIALLK